MHNLISQITKCAPLRIRAYIPTLTLVIGTLDRTASTVGMVTGEKSRRGFVCEIREVFILLYGVWF